MCLCVCLRAYVKACLLTVVSLEMVNNLREQKLDITARSTQDAQCARSTVNIIHYYVGRILFEAAILIGLDLYSHTHCLTYFFSLNFDRFLEFGTIEFVNRLFIIYCIYDGPQNGRAHSQMTLGRFY